MEAGRGDLTGSAGFGAGSKRQEGGGDLHAKKPLVERSGEEGIQQVLMDQSQAQDTPTETEPGHKTGSFSTRTGFIGPFK